MRIKTVLSYSESLKNILQMDMCHTAPSLEPNSLFRKKGPKHRGYSWRIEKP
jgi:hypothetical protein